MLGPALWPTLVYTYIVEPEETFIATHWHRKHYTQKCKNNWKQCFLFSWCWGYIMRTKRPSNSVMSSFTSASCETEIYGCESNGTQNQKWLLMRVSSNLPELKWSESEMWDRKIMSWVLRCLEPIMTAQQPFTRNWRQVSCELEVGSHSWWLAVSSEAEESPLLETDTNKWLLKI